MRDRGPWSRSQEVPWSLWCLRTRSIGRLAYVARAGRPDVVPVNYAVQGDDLDHAGRTGWSVVAAGPARRLTGAEHAAVAGDDPPVTWAAGPRHALIRVRIERPEGRRLH